MKQQKSAFSFIELLITVSIVILLTIIGLSVNTSYTIKANNARVTADLDTAHIALLGHIEAEGNLPLPGGNKNYYTQTGSYEHDWTSTNTFGVYGSLTDHVLSKKYLDSTPKDNKTNNFFAYGITKPNLSKDIANQFEIASVIQNGDEFISLVKGNYTGKSDLYNLIRSYNGPDYVYNNSKSLYPYDPSSVQVSATLANITGNVSINGDINNLDRQLVSGDTITVEAGSRAEIYFSDGSVSVLGGPSTTQNTVINISDFSTPRDNNLVSRVSLFLSSGNIWTKATDLNSDGSDFQISTVDGTASVRGTIFGVSYAGQTQVTVVQGNVEITSQRIPETILEVAENEAPKSLIIEGSSIDEYPSEIPEVDLNTKEITPVRSEVISDTSISDNPTQNNQQAGSADTTIPTNVDSNLTTTPNNCSATYLDGYNLTDANNGHDEYFQKSSTDHNTGITTTTTQKHLCNTNGNWQKFPGVAPSNDYSCSDLDGRERTIFAGNCEEKVDGKSLYAKADFNIDGDIDLKKANGYNFPKYHQLVLNVGNPTTLPSYCDGNSNPSNSFCKTNGTKGVVLDNSEDDDYIKYTNLNLDNNFIIEIKVNVENNSDIQYLMHSGNNIKLYIQNQKLWLNPTSATDNISIAEGLQSIKLVRSGGQLKASVNGVHTDNRLINSNIDYIYLGTSYSTGNNAYIFQINNIIDYFKIYK